MLNLLELRIFIVVRDSSVHRQKMCDFAYLSLGVDLVQRVMARLGEVALTVCVSLGR